jgi:hypothetical protein
VTSFILQRASAFDYNPTDDSTARLAAGQAASIFFIFGSELASITAKLAATTPPLAYAIGSVE